MLYDGFKNLQFNRSKNGRYLAEPSVVSFHTDSSLACKFVPSNKVSFVTQQSLAPVSSAQALKALLPWNVWKTIYAAPCDCLTTVSQASASLASNVKWVINCCQIPDLSLMALQARGNVGWQYRSITGLVSLWPSDIPRQLNIWW